MKPRILKHTPKPKQLKLSDVALDVSTDGPGLTITARPKDGGRVLPLKKPDAE